MFCKFVDSLQNLDEFTPKLPSIVPKGGPVSAPFDRINMSTACFTGAPLKKNSFINYSKLVITPHQLLKYPHA